MVFLQINFRCKVTLKRAGHQSINYVNEFKRVSIKVDGQNKCKVYDVTTNQSYGITDANAVI